MYNTKKHSLSNRLVSIQTSCESHSKGKTKAKIEAYKEIHGYYPDLVQVDKAYATRENRKWLKENDIRITAPPLGRKKKVQAKTNYQKRKNKREAAERNHIEGKFGQAKNGYNLNQVKAKLKSTSESWVSCIFFIMNLINYQKKVLFCSFLLFFNSIK